MTTLEEEAFRELNSQAGADLYAPKVGAALYGQAHLHVITVIDHQDGYASSNEIMEIFNI